MAHNHMDHGGMGHGGHSGHDMPMGGGHQCSMNMIFTWDTTNLCLIFDWWHVSGPWSLIFSLVGVVVLTAGYEAVREASRRYELSSAEGFNRLPPDETPAAGSGGIVESSRSWFKLVGQSQEAQQQRDKIIKGAFYAAQVFYSFFIMLLFMTYNGFVMVAVAVGAFVGYLVFGQGSATKTVACH